MPSTLDPPLINAKQAQTEIITRLIRSLTLKRTHVSLTSLVLVTYRCHGCLDQKYRVHGDLQIIAQVNVYSPVYVYVPRGTRKENVTKTSIHTRCVY